MVPQKIKIVRSENGINKEYVLRRFEDKDVHRIFMAWNNPQSYIYNSIDWSEERVKELAYTTWPSEWGMYFMVLEDVSTGEILGTCRFGGNPKDESKTWNFGYCTFRGDDKETYTLDDVRDAVRNGVKKDDLCWGKGYASMIVGKIIDIAQAEGVSQIIAGADSKNFGSQKVMMKNGMIFHEFDADYDVDMIIKLRDENGKLLPINKPTKEVIDTMWNKHIGMVNEKLSEQVVINKTEENKINHEGDCYVYLLLNRASKIMLKKGNIENLQQDIRDSYLKLTLEELALFNRRFNEYKNRWQKRMGHVDFDDEEVAFNLGCCRIIDAELSKIKASML